jgi:hypothetical protein
MIMFIGLVCSKLNVLFTHQILNAHLQIDAISKTFICIKSNDMYL